jgi:phosphoribosylanthranilate isomerase
MALVKICGITSPADAEACAKLGAAAVGVNFVPSSPRRVTAEVARSIAGALAGSKVLVVGVVANMTVADMKRLVSDAKLGCLQLHGSESAETVGAVLPHAYKAVRIATPHDVAGARAFPGEHLLVDAKVEGALGGTGQTFDWTLVAELAKERKLTLAGGLTPDNVGAAVRLTKPYCVDVASGVESAPGRKDLVLVRDFIAAARCI